MWCVAWVTCLVIVKIKRRRTYVCYMSLMEALHHVTWLQDVTYSDIINEYVTYAKRRHCNATVQLCSTDTTVNLQQRMSHTIAEGVDELHPTLTVPEICLSVSRWSNFEATNQHKQRLIRAFSDAVYVVIRSGI